MKNKKNKSQIRNSSPEIFKQSKELIKSANKTVKNSRLNKNNDIVVSADSRLEFCTAILYCKGIKIFKHIYSLCLEGAGDCAAILARTLFETLVNLLLIIRGDRLAEDFIDFYFIEAFDCFKDIKKHFEDLELSEDEEDFMMWGYNKVVARFKNKSGRTKKDWYKKESTADKASDVGLSRHYDLGYRRYSAIAHSSPEAMFDHIRANHNESEVRLSYQPSEQYIKEILPESSKYFILILYVFVKIFKLNVTEELKADMKILKDNEDYQECFKKNEILAENFL